MTLKKNIAYIILSGTTLFGSVGYTINQFYKSDEVRNNSEYNEEDKDDAKTGLLRCIAPIIAVGGLVGLLINIAEIQEDKRTRKTIKDFRKLNAKTNYPKNL